MEVVNLILGSYQTNCYILYEPGKAEGIVIDPGFEPETVIGRLKALEVRPKYILATHGHGDHTGAIPLLKEAYPEALVLIHEKDKALTGNRLRRIPDKTEAVQVPVCDGGLEEGDEILCGGIRLRVAHTPGHTAGGVCLIAEESGCVFAGDTLFNGSIGRTDLPGGDFGAIEISIRQKLYCLPPDMLVYPGHGPATSIGKERQSNPFVRDEGSFKDSIHG